MPEGGDLQVSASILADQEIEIVVRDTGCGVAPENLSKLFDPYFTTKVRGFGLGLSIVERIVEEQAGTIAVASEQGIGTTFTIKLPACPAPENIEICTT